MVIDLDFDGIKSRLMKITATKSLSGIAAAIDMSGSSVTNWNKAKKIPGDVVIKACIKYGASVDYVLFGKSDKPSEKNAHEAFGNALAKLVAGEHIEIKETYNINAVIEICNELMNDISSKENVEHLDPIKLMSANKPC